MLKLRLYRMTDGEPFFAYPVSRRFRRWRTPDLLIVLPCSCICWSCGPWCSTNAISLVVVAIVVIVVIVVVFELYRYSPWFGFRVFLSREPFSRAYLVSRASLAGRLFHWTSNNKKTGWLIHERAALVGKARIRLNETMDTTPRLAPLPGWKLYILL